MAATKEEDRKGRLAIIIIKEKTKARAVQKQKEEECSFTVQQKRRKKAADRYTSSNNSHSYISKYSPGLYVHNNQNAMHAVCLIILSTRDHYMCPMP